MLTYCHRIFGNAGNEKEFLDGIIKQMKDLEKQAEDAISRIEIGKKAIEAYFDLRDDFCKKQSLNVFGDILRIKSMLALLKTANNDTVNKTCEESTADVDLYCYRFNDACKSVQQKIRDAEECIAHRAVKGKNYDIRA